MFGAGIDPSAAGKKSLVGRKLREQKRLEEAVLERGNGYARLKVLELRRQRQEALEAERLRLDHECVALYDEREEVGAQVAELRDERDRARNARAALVRRLELLRASVSASEAQLVERLRALHEADGLEPALEKLGLLERVDEP